MRECSKELTTWAWLGLFDLLDSQVQHWALPGVRVEEKGFTRVLFLLTIWSHAYNDTQLCLNILACFRKLITPSPSGHLAQNRTWSRHWTNAGTTAEVIWNKSLLHFVLAPSTPGSCNVPSSPSLPSKSRWIRLDFTLRIYWRVLKRKIISASHAADGNITNGWRRKKKEDTH